MDRVIIMTAALSIAAALTACGNTVGEGAATGGVAGALVAGPVGAVVGGTAGAVSKSNGTHHKKR